MNGVIYGLISLGLGAEMESTIGLENVSFSKTAVMTPKEATVVAMKLIMTL